jgi:hypothetical protein
MGRRQRILSVSSAIVFATLLIPIRWDASNGLRLATPGEQAASAATLQTIGLVATVLFAAAGIRVAGETLRSDQRDRRVDRVLAFHEELTGSGPTGVARSRLARFLREQGGPGSVVLQVGREQLVEDPRVQTYSRGTAAGASTPHTDLTLILRLFERIRISQVAESLDDHLLASLIGRHAGWWDLAIADDDKDTLRIPLERLAEWCDAYRDENPNQPGFENWGDSRSRAFPHGHISATQLSWPHPNHRGQDRDHKISPKSKRWKPFIRP